MSLLYDLILISVHLLFELSSYEFILSDLLGTVLIL